MSPPRKKASSPARPSPEESPPATARAALTWLRAHGSKEVLDGMARYAIPATDAFGVSVGDTKALGKAMGKNHDLALELWESGKYEARLLAVFTAEPEMLTVAQMNAWASDFDNWAIVDTACFHLFDRTRHAWKKARQWSRAKAEFKKRAAFALVWSLSVHDKESTDEPFLESLEWIERAARDERNFVKKAVDMSLRAVGKRNRALNRAALEVAKRLAESSDRTEAWIGRHAAKELESAGVQKRLAGR